MVAEAIEGGNKEMTGRILSKGIWKGNSLEMIGIKKRETNYSG